MDEESDDLEAEISIITQIQAAEEQLVVAKENGDEHMRRRLKDRLNYLHARRRKIQGYT